MGPRPARHVVWMWVCTDIDNLVAVRCITNHLFHSLSMNHGNCDTAVDMLKAQFDRSDGGVGEVTQAWYSIYGDVVSYYHSLYLIRLFCVFSNYLYTKRLHSAVHKAHFLSFPASTPIISVASLIDVAGMFQEHFPRLP